MKFTDLMIKNLQPKENRYELREADGFAVRVSTVGKKTWVFFYDFEGRRRRMTLGQYPVMKLKDARKKHGEALSLLRDGKDPGSAAIGEKAERLRTPTFEEFGNEFIERWSKPKKKSWKEDQRQLEKYILPSWRRTKVCDLTRRDISTLLDPLTERAPVQANRTFALVRKIFNFAVERGVIEASPCTGLPAPSKEKSKKRNLSAKEIETFWSNLDRAGMTDEVKRALKLMLITGQRPGEVAGMHREEINGPWWTIPESRTKNEKEHRVYLTPLAFSIIGDKDGYIFKLPKEQKPITVGAIGMAIRRALKPNKKFGEPAIPLPKFSPHDLRRTCTSQISSLGHAAFVDKILNHTDTRVTAVYDKYSYDREKRMALTDWSDRLAEILGLNPTSQAPLTVPRLREFASEILSDGTEDSELRQLAEVIEQAGDNVLHQLLGVPDAEKTQRKEKTSLRVVGKSSTGKQAERANYG